MPIVFCNGVSDSSNKHGAAHASYAPAIDVDESDGSSGAHNRILEVYCGGFLKWWRRPTLCRPTYFVLSVVDPGQVVAVAQYPGATELNRGWLWEVQRVHPMKSVFVSNMWLMKEWVFVPARQRRLVTLRVTDGDVGVPVRMQVAARTTE